MNSEHSHTEGTGGIDVPRLEADVLEVARELEQRYGEAGPTPEQEKAFLREWLIGKGRSEEQVDAILNS